MSARRRRYGRFWFLHRALLLAETNMTVKIADRNVGLEARALAGRRLLLHGLDGHDLVLELTSGL